MNTRTPSTAATLRLDLHTEATANARGKGLRTRVRAGDNPGMGPYNDPIRCDSTYENGHYYYECKWVGE